MLQEDRQHDAGQPEPAAVNRYAEHEAGQRQGGGIDLQSALDVPLGIEGLDAAQALRASRCL